MDITTFSECVSRFATERIAPALPPAGGAVVSVLAAVVRIRPALLQATAEALYPVLAPLGVVRRDGTLDAGVISVAASGYFKTAKEWTIDLGSLKGVTGVAQRLGVRLPAGLRLTITAEDAEAFCDILGQYEPVAVEPPPPFSPKEAS